MLNSPARTRDRTFWRADLNNCGRPFMLRVLLADGGDDLPLLVRRHGMTCSVNEKGAGVLARIVMSIVILVCMK